MLDLKEKLQIVYLQDESSKDMIMTNKYLYFMKGVRLWSFYPLESL